MRISAFPSRLLIAALACFVSWTASAQENWVQHLKVLTQNMSYDAAGDQFLGAGNEAIWFSTDGQLWTARVVEGIHQDVVRARSTYVAVGSNANRKLITTSSNGKVWDAIPFQSSGAFRGVSFSFGKFYVVGDGGSIFSSTNASAWFPVTIPNEFQSTDFLSISYLNNRLCVTGARGAIMTSVDGTNWTKFELPVPDVITGVTYGRGQFMASTDKGEIYSSLDGRKWQLKAILTFGITRMGFNPDAEYFIATGTFESIAASKTGAVWDTIQQNNGTVSTANLNSLAFGQGLFVAGTDRGAFYRVPDPYSPYQQLEVSGSWQFRALAAGGGYFFGVGDGVTALWDGETGWDIDTILEAYNDVTFGNQNFYTGATDSIEIYDNEVRLFDFVDLSTYYDTRTPKDFEEGVKDHSFLIVKSVAAGAGYVCAATDAWDPSPGAGSGFLLWNTATMSSDLASPLNGAPSAYESNITGNAVAFGRNELTEPTFVMVGPLGIVWVITVTSNAYSVQYRPSGTNEELIDVTYVNDEEVGNKGFFALSNNGVVTYSADAKFWRSLKIDNLGTEIPKTICYGNQQLVVVCSSGAIFSAKVKPGSITGGINPVWIKRGSPVSLPADDENPTDLDILAGLAFSKGKFAAIGNSVAISSTDEVFPPKITGERTAKGAVGEEFLYKFSLENGVDTVELAGEIPPGLELSGTRSIRGIPEKKGIYSTKIVATNRGGTTTFNVRITIKPEQPPSIEGASVANGREGVAFSYSFKTAGDVDKLTLEGAPLPAGLKLNKGAQTITGIPTEDRVSDIRIVASNFSGEEAKLPVRITIVDKNAPTDPPEVTSPGKATAEIGEPFSYTITTKGKVDTIQVTGKLPPGVKQTSGTIISGTPTKLGKYKSVIQATNSAGTGEQILTISVVDTVKPVMSDFDPKTLNLVTDKKQIPVTGKVTDNVNPVAIQYRFRKVGNNWPAYTTVPLSSTVTRTKGFRFVLDVSSIASYEVEYFAVDESGNSSNTRRLNIERTDADPK